MTQKKSIASKLLLAAIALTLISFCFLGSTFARYTSSNNGSASLNVAEWDVSITPTADTTATFGKLAPNPNAYVDTVRTSTSARILVAELTNGGDVDAVVTLDVDDLPTLTNIGGDWTYSETEIQGLFSIKLYTNTSDNAGDAQEWHESDTFDLAKTSGTLYIYAEVTWTSDDASVKGEPADKRDTWVGENITALSYDLTYEAVQKVA